MKLAREKRGGRWGGLLDAVEAAVADAARDESVADGLGSKVPEPQQQTEVPVGDREQSGPLEVTWTVPAALWA